MPWKQGELALYTPLFSVAASAVCVSMVYGPILSRLRSTAPTFSNLVLLGSSHTCSLPLRDIYGQVPGTKRRTRRCMTDNPSNKERTIGPCRCGGIPNCVACHCCSMVRSLFCDPRTRPRASWWREKQHEHHHNLGILLPKASRLQMVFWSTPSTAPQFRSIRMLYCFHDTMIHHDPVLRFVWTLSSDLHILFTMVFRCCGQRTHHIAAM